MKKFLSMLLSVVLVFGVCSISAFAVAETATDAPATKLVTSIDVSFDFDIGGKKVGDYEDYITINTAGVEFEDNYDGLGAFANFLDGGSAEEYIEGEIYGISVYLTPEDGYAFPLSGDFVVTVNGKEHACSLFIGEQYDEELEEFVEVPTCDFFIIAAIGPEGGFAEGRTSKLIKEISIDIAPVAGMSVADWEEYVKINTPNLEFDDENGYPGAFVYDENYTALPSNYIFVAGQEYYIEAQLAPASGYCFPFDGVEKVTVNGEATEDYYIDSYYNDNYVVVDYASVAGYESASGENSPFDLISNYFTTFFAGIESYFAGIIQRILLIIMLLG